MTASLRVKNDKYYVVLTHTTDGKKNQTWVSTGLSVTGNEGKARQINLQEWHLLEFSTILYLFQLPENLLVCTFAGLYEL